MDFLSLFSIFVLSVFVGFYVVWGVTPALHSPLLAVTNAISSVIIVGGLIAAVASKGINRCSFSIRKYIWWFYGRSKNVSNV